MKILILEDSRTYALLIKKFLEKNLVFVECDIIASFKDFQENSKEYDLYIVDYVLPDVQADEHIKYLLENNKKIIIMTQFEEKVLDLKLLDKVIDFVIKDDVSVINYLVRLVKRFYKNRFLNVLVVEDSKTIRAVEVSHLKLLNFNIFEAENGEEALKVLEKEHIDLVITDIEMPKLDGIGLVKEIRKEHSIDDLPILVVSSVESVYTALKILKLGANDFVRKPFQKAELIIRINNLLEIYDYLSKYKNDSFIDGLTKVYNRFYLETNLENMFKLCPVKSVAMLDIDFFKKVNDTYGHQKGDEVLVHFASLIKNNVRKEDVVVRYGGEEFLIFMPNTSKKEAFVVLMKLKKLLEAADDKPVPYTFSAGISDEGETLAEMIKNADEKLYQSKENGRNRITI